MVSKLQVDEDLIRLIRFGGGMKQSSFGNCLNLSLSGPACQHG